MNKQNKRKDTRRSNVYIENILILCAQENFAGGALGWPAVLFITQHIGMVEHVLV